MRDSDEAISGDGLAVGQVQMRKGILCSVDAHGRFYLRAPRRADVALAQRVVATMAAAGDDVSSRLVADLTSVREERGR